LERQFAGHALAGRNGPTGNDGPVLKLGMATRFLGFAYAWYEDEQCFYALARYLAPDSAVKVKRYEVDGQVVLHHETGGSGHFIRNAKLVQSRGSG
jgi:hypothetical protein